MAESWQKAWGTNTEIFRNASTSVNYLDLKKGGTCSHHYHRFKFNIFYVIKGQLKLVTELGETILNVGQSSLISPPNKHHFVAMEDTLAVEIMYVEYSTDDIIRENQGHFDGGI